MLKLRSILLVLSLAAGMTVTASSPAVGSILVGSFDTGLGPLVAVGFDDGPATVLTYAEFGDAIREFSMDGQPLSTIPRPGLSSDDFDLDVLPATVQIGRGTVPAGSVLVTNGETQPQQLFGINRQGAILGQIDLSGTLVGGSYHPGRGTVFVVDWNSDRIQEINPATGAVANDFPVRPAGSPDFGVFHGDVAVGPNENLFVVGSAQAYVRELTPTGGFIRDYEVGALGIEEMSGISFIRSEDDAWISTHQSGVLYRVELGPSDLDRVGCQTGDTCGGGSDDTLSGNNGTIEGGAGDDTITGIVDEGTSELIIKAGTGNDTITLDFQDATRSITVRVLGDGGNDTIIVPQDPGALSPNLVAGGGNDLIEVHEPSASRRVALAQGTPAGRYVINAGGGNDRVTSGISGDRIRLAAGRDFVDGGAGADRLDAGGGFDEVEGGAGNDEMLGRAGRDVLHGGNGTNRFKGGLGRDTCLSDTRRDRFSSCERIRHNHRRNHQAI